MKAFEDGQLVKLDIYGNKVTGNFISQDGTHIKLSIISDTQSVFHVGEIGDVDISHLDEDGDTPIKDCPLCAAIGTVQKTWANQKIEYDHRNYRVQAYFHKCSACNEEFTTTEQDTKTLAQLFSLVQQHKV